MRPDDAVVRDLAARILAREGPDPPAPAAPADALLVAFRKLLARLTVLIGKTGAYALLARAASRACKAYPFLEGVRIRDDSDLDGLHEVLRGRDPGESLAAAGAILSALISLLVLFIGEAHTFRLIGDAWADIPLVEGSAPGAPEGEDP